MKTLTELKVVTYHPETYVLVNENDGTRWRGKIGEARRGTWEEETPQLETRLQRLVVRRLWLRGIAKLTAYALVTVAAAILAGWVAAKVF